MTIGGSGAASLIFDYLKEKYHECIIVLVGMNYSLYERLGRKHNFTILEITSQSSIGCLPTMQEFKNMQQSTLKKVFVFSNPNNPSGLIYDYEKFSKILRYIHEINGFVIWIRFVICQFLKSLIYFWKMLLLNVICGTMQLL